MNGHFDITIDPARKLLRITLRGFFSAENVGEYLVAKNAALTRLNCRPNQHVTLVDVSASKLQSQDVVRAFQSTIADPRHQSRRIAIVTGSSLARMQVRRLLTRDNAGCFETIEEAEAWLIRPEHSA